MVSVVFSLENDIIDWALFENICDLNIITVFGLIEYHYLFLIFLK
jgi:hypothetical protein